MRTFFFTYMGLGLLIGACASDDNIRIMEQVSYPEISTVGKGVFAFMTEDSQFISYFANNNFNLVKQSEVEVPAPPGLDARYFFDESNKEYVFKIEARSHKDNGRDYVHLEYSSMKQLKAGDKLIIGRNGDKNVVHIEYNRYLDNLWQNYTSVDGELEILKVNETNKIIAATFHLNSETKAQYGMLLEMKQGRLDVVYSSFH